MTDLDGLLATWLPQQRWFAGKGRPVASVRTETARVLGERDGVRVLDLVVAVAHPQADGEDIVRYQVPVTVHDDAPDAVEFARIGVTDEGEVRGVVHDGLADPDGSAVWLQHLAAGAGPAGLAVERVAEIDADQPGRTAGVEQSNTSVVYGDVAILKVFRRLAPGTNPDLEVTRALAAAGSPHVAAPLAWVTGEVAGEPTTLAFLQRFLRHGTDGWKLATTSVRDLFAEGDLHADEVGGDFAGESHRLGRATAEVHATLREVLPTRTAGAAETQATAAQMRARLAEAVAEVPALADLAPRLAAAYDAVVALTDDVPVQRVHGDFHLGQVLRTDAGWALLDFEGEPARPLAERTTLMSPLRDVAGMLRSFDYAARSLLAERQVDPQSEHGLTYRAAEWAERNRSAFCDGYAAASGTDPREAAVLLRACELDKAVYEVVYEARHRPTWIGIPLGSIQRLIDTDPSSEHAGT